MLSAINTGFYTALKYWAETWVKNTAYVLGDVVKPTVYNSHTYKCTTAGTSHTTTEPTWGTTNGGTTADGTVTWTCWDNRTYNLKAPQNSVLPYVTFGLLTDRPIGTFEDLAIIEDLTFWINAFSNVSVADVSEIADEILAVMDGATLSVSGYSPMVCRREYIGTPIWDSETLIFQIPLRYRVQISL
jgi:hypothetical protein